MKVDGIIKEIENGKALYIQTALTFTKVDKKTLNRFAKAGHQVLKDGKEGEHGFYIARGKNWDYVSAGCKVWIE